MADTPSGTPERVAYELMMLTRSLLPEKRDLERVKQILDLYSACLQATTGKEVDADLLS